MQAIIMDRNNITQLAKYQFYNANWAEVRKISLQFCELNSFDKSTFYGLANLHYLDLSHNHLSALDSDQLPSLPSLRTLDLSFNYLVSIHSDSFSGLGATLVRIDLSDNRLTSVFWTVFQHLPSLRLVKLDNNPWNCDCSLGGLHSGLIKSNILSGNPSCSSPHRLSFKAWASLSSNEFTCRPTVSLPLHPPVLPGQDIPLRCKVAGYPKPIITWKKDGQLIPESNEFNSVETSQLDSSGDNEVLSVLTIMNITSSSVGQYSCVASSLEGTDQKDVLVAFPSSDRIVLEATGESLFTIIIICVGTTILVIIFLALIVTFCLRNVLDLKSKRKCSKLENTTSSLSSLPVFTQKPTKKISADVSGTLSRSSLQRSYLLSDTYEDDLMDASREKYLMDEIDNIYEHTSNTPSLVSVPNVEQSSLVNNTPGTRASILTSRGLLEPVPVYGTLRHAPSRTPSYRQRPGYVTLPRRPRQRPAIYQDDGLGPRTSADGSSINNISIKSEGTMTNPILLTPLSSINTVGLPLLDRSLPVRASTPNSSITSDHRATLGIIVEHA